MTSKERVLAACRHEQPDRVPLQVYLTPEIRAALQAHFGDRDILEALGVDLRHVGAPYTAERGPGPGLPGRADSYDIFGTGYTNKHYEGGTYPEATELPFADMDSVDEVEAYPWPDPDDYDYSALRERAEALGEYAVVFGGAGIPDIVNGVSRARGMERVLVDIMTNDPVGIAIIDHRVEHYYEHCRRALEAAGGAIDILALGEDCGDQRGRLFPPQAFDDFFVPRIKPFIDLAHEHGCLAMLHSCGDTHEIMPTFVEMGLDILDAMQPEPAGMDPATIKREFGRDLTFCGLVSTQQTLPHGSVEDVRREVRERINIVGAGGGYILAPAHCIQPDTPLQNVLAMYDEALPGGLS
jgi:uroporphyrinogen decarboxylase